MPIKTALAIVLTICTATSTAFGQTKAPVECKRQALAALKPIPKLTFECEGDNDWDDKFLALPNRLEALKSYESRLATLTDPDWWSLPVSDLNVCEFHPGPGPLTDDEQRQYSDQGPHLFGNERIRVVRTPDPCYQTEFGGSVVFVLNRHQGRVVVTKVIDGFASRADNPMFMSFIREGPQQIIEIATGSGGLYPDATNYYFTIDPRSGKAVPKKLFLLGGVLTNHINSDLILDTMKDLGKPESWEPLRIALRNGRLAKEFSIYNRIIGDKTGRKAAIETDNESYTRTVFKWTGRFYKEIPK